MNGMVRELRGRDEYKNLTNAERANLANLKRVPFRDGEKKNFNWFLHHGDFTQAQCDSFAGLLLQTNRHATYGAMIGEGLPFDTDKMQAGLDEIAAEHSNNPAIVAMVEKIKAIGRRAISDYEVMAGSGALATAEMFDAEDAENARMELLRMAETSFDRVKRMILQGQLTSEAAVKAELGK